MAKPRSTLVDSLLKSWGEWVATCEAKGVYPATAFGALVSGEPVHHDKHRRPSSALPRLYPSAPSRKVRVVHEVWLELHAKGGPYQRAARVMHHQHVNRARRDAIAQAMRIKPAQVNDSVTLSRMAVKLALIGAAAAIQ